MLSYDGTGITGEPGCRGAAPETEARDPANGACRSNPAARGRLQILSRAQRDRNVRDGFHPVGFRPGVLGSGWYVLRSARVSRLQVLQYHV